MALITMLHQDGANFLFEEVDAVIGVRQGDASQQKENGSGEFHVENHRTMPVSLASSNPLGALTRLFVMSTGGAEFVSSQTSSPSQSIRSQSPSATRHPLYYGPLVPGIPGLRS